MTHFCWKFANRKFETVFSTDKITTYRYYTQMIHLQNVDIYFVRWREVISTTKSPIVYTYSWVINENLQQLNIPIFKKCLKFREK